MLLGLFNRLKAPRREASSVLCQLSLVQNAEAATPPEWIELIPAGEVVNTVDGRTFANTHPEKVVQAFRDYKLQLPIDFEHATEIRAPEGMEAPAAGWITELQVRSGAIWAHVEWTPRGAAALISREYRYISPAFFLDTETREVLELTSAGLTNRPALTQLPAVARRQHEEFSVKREELIKALGLAAEATDEQITAAIAEAVKAKGAVAQAQNELATARSELAKGPGLDKFVPRADFETERAARLAAEAKVKEVADAAHKAKVDAAIDAASKAGKITPATVEYHRAQCTDADGLKRFEAFVAAAPVIAADGKFNGKPPGDSNSDTLTEQEKIVARNCGLTEAEFLKSKPKAQ